MDKTFAALWEGQEIKKEFLKEVDGIKVSKITANTIFVGYYAVATSRSKADYFDYMVVYSPELKIMAVKLLVYREDYGGEIGSNRWLKQFKGKTSTSEMKFGHDIQNISGATISARSITVGIQKTTKEVNTLKEKGTI